MKTKNTQNVQRITVTAVFLAILILQTYVPNLGYIRILPSLPSLTIIPLTIAVYSALMGPRAGLLFGLVWGLLRLLMAYTTPQDPVSLLLFQNPIIALVPSVVAGWAPGLIAKIGNDKGGWTEKMCDFGTGFFAAVLNTLLVVTLTTLIFMNDPSVLMKDLGNASSNTPLFVILLTSLAANGVFEAAFNGFLSLLILPPLTSAFRHMFRVSR